MKNKIIVIVSICLFHAPNIFAQQVSEFSQLYIGIEAGVSKGYDYFIQFGAAVHFDKDYYRIRLATAFDEPSAIQKQTFKQDENCGCMDSKGVTDYGFIYGRSYSFEKRHRIQFGSGISIITRTDPDEAFNAEKNADELDRYLKKRALGLPFEFKYAFRVGRNIELTSSMNLNINAVQSYTGFSAGIAFKSLFN
jgi:hypothetical protein